MELITLSAQQLREWEFKQNTILISMADSGEQIVSLSQNGNISARLVLIFNDARDAYRGVRPPRVEDAEKILEFVRSNASAAFLVIQCQVGLGRSHAVAAGLAKIFGNEESSRRIRHNGTYNRRLFSLLLQAANVQADPEPLVSLAIRVKYASDRLALFLLSMQRQRYENWEVVAVTDGPNPSAVEHVQALGDGRIKIIETDKCLGRWGHPYRQTGIQACSGEFIGLSNDDNYYVPGYIEQMMNALTDAEIALCQTLHSYAAWGIVGVGGDLGCWIAKASLVKSTPWTGVEFDSDDRYLKLLLQKASGRVAEVNRPLFVHN